ncbi:DUF6011 domain-containing protein [Gordonia sp. NPDC003422]
MSPGNDAAPGRATEGRQQDPCGGRISADSITELDLDQYLDPADKLMLAALREGNYVLAVVCRVCGSPLTAKRSRQLGVGPACRKRVAE